MPSCRARRAGGQALTDGLKTFPDGFAAVMLRSYLEHERSRAPCWGELQRTPAPGGVAIIKVPNYASLNRRVTGRKWCGSAIPIT